MLEILVQPVITPSLQLGYNRISMIFRIKASAEEARGGEREYAMIGYDPSDNPQRRGQSDADPIERKKSLKKNA